MTPEDAELKSFLDAVAESFDAKAQREHDPVSIPWSYPENDDREVVAFVSAALAYGRVTTLKKAIRTVLEPWGEHPANALRNASENDIEDAVGAFQYRMTFAPDMVDLLVGISRVLNESGSLFAAYDGHGSHLKNASALVQTIRENRVRSDLSRGLRYLTVDPNDGSTAKRLQLFLRWVIRGPDDVDFGLWDVEPSVLIAPVDTHTARLWRYVGLLNRRTVDLKFAIEVSERLRTFRPEDPIYYDFPICHLGISKRCIHKRSDEHCPTCEIESICRLS